MGDKRVFPRVERETPAEYTRDGQARRCLALDLGVGGACLVCDESLEGVTELEISFELTPDWTVPARARPVWERTRDGRFLVGITYRPVRSADKHLIGPWVHKARKAAGQKPLVPPTPVTVPFSYPRYEHDVVAEAEAIPEDGAN